MTRRSTLVTAALLVAAAGCGTVTARPHPHPSAAPPAPPSLATSLVTSGGTWAVAELGGSAAQYNNFWQIFVRPAGSAAWRLATPPGVASNGGLVLAGLAGRSALAGFRPSQALIFSPLAATSDDGRTWSGSIVDAGLANVPDALAAAPGGGRFLALVSGGVIEQAGSTAATWSRLASLRSLATSPAGRQCLPSAPAAVSFNPSGTPVLAVDCTRSGLTGIYSFTVGAWRLAAPVLGGQDAGQRVQVLRLTTTGAGETALLAAGTGSATKLLAAWTSDGQHWSVSGQLPLGGGRVAASGFGAAGQAWVLLASGQAEMITGKGSRLAGAAAAASHLGRTRVRPGRDRRRAGRQGHQAHRLAAGRRSGGLAPRPGDQRPHPVRLVGLIGAYYPKHPNDPAIDRRGPGETIRMITKTFWCPST